MGGAVTSGPRGDNQWWRWSHSVSPPPFWCVSPPRPPRAPTAPCRPLCTPLPQAHLGTCGFNVIPCPNRCSTNLSRRDLPQHLQHGCPKRRVQCEFCAGDFTGEAFEVGTARGQCEHGDAMGDVREWGVGWAAPPSAIPVTPISPVN